MLELIEFQDGHYEKITYEGDETFLSVATKEEVAIWERIQAQPTSGTVSELNKIFSR